VPGAGRPELATRHLTEEEKMKPPPCPQEQDFSVLSGFITPGSDFPPPHPLDASITVEILDPDEHNERVRIVETVDRWAVEVDWCICGPFAAALCGCWCVQVFIDDIDGVGPTHGLLGSARVSVDSQPIVQVDDTSQRCYEYTFVFTPDPNRQGIFRQVGAGVYNLVVVITLATGSCEKPGPLLHDTLGYAAIPVLVFFDENAPFCPSPDDRVVAAS
jgi:hypothetical protein